MNFSGFLKLSNIANILPYYDNYAKNELLVRDLNPELLDNFALVLGKPLFGDLFTDKELFE